MNIVLLKYYMACNKDNEASLAESLGIHRLTLNKKLKGKVSFNLEELNHIRQRYGLNATQFYQVFFDVSEE